MRSVPPTAAPSGPLVLDRYRLTRQLGAGAFGTVWMARDERLERDVAVKILARERIVGGRFEREARAAARLSHPAIVTLYEAAVDDEGAYLVSELIRGSTLDALLDAGWLSDRDIVAIAVVLCDALAHAHQQGVVHRDVKPSNVLVPDAPASVAQVAKLTDFGVARVVGGDVLTMTGDVIGTLAYMAPEQAEGLEAGPEADLYSLALVVYEALTGVNPIAGEGTQRSRRLGTQLPPLRRQRRDLPGELGQGIGLALRPRPGERGTVGELRRALVLAHDQVGDEPGIVDAPIRPWTALRTRRDEDGPGDDETASTRLWAPSRPGPPEPEPEPAPDRSDDQGKSGGPAGRPAPLSLPGLARAVALAGAGITAAWLVHSPALAPAPVPPLLAALFAVAAVLLLPRLGWGAVAIALAAAAVTRHHPGAAVVILLAFALPPLLLPLRPALWPVAAGAPALGLLGVAGLAGAWPALAGRAGTPLRRAALAAAGWLWLLLAGPLSGHGLYVPLAAGTPPPGGWIGSLPATVEQVLRPMVAAGVLAPAAVWALAAAVLPWLAAGRRPAADVVRVVVWSAALATATGAAIAAAGGPGAPATAPGAVLGAIAGAVAAIGPSLVGRWREVG